MSMCAVKGSGMQHLGKSRTSPCVHHMGEARWIGHLEAEYGFFFFFYLWTIYKGALEDLS